MAERVLRDHNEPCKHAPDDYKKVWGDRFHIGHDYQWVPGHSGWCSGGREVTDDDLRLLLDDLAKRDAEERQTPGGR